MGWISELFSSSVGSVVDSIGKAIDDNVTNDEERLVLRNELVKIQAEARGKAEQIDVQIEQEVTKRHQADMQSDSWLSKNVRPGSLVFLLSVVSLLSITDGNIQYGEWVFTIKGEYITLFKSLLLVAFGFYFSSRGVEKVVNAWKGNKQ